MIDEGIDKYYTSSSSGFYSGFYMYMGLVEQIS